tara:strand:+ start:2221 stop:2571 length:351 start_codon:yes stop_codon:yes gene_type:complete
MTNIRDIKEEDVNELVDLAKKDGHGLWRPTSIIEVDGKIKGSLSIGGVPLITAFISKEVDSPYVFREVMKQGKDTISNAGFPDYLVALNDDSPAFKFMPKFGLQPYQSVMWYGQTQ